ncbi:TPA: recombination protein NinG [Escherichia coli]|nr:recombination protein NinG [Escherichia coli]
MMKQRKPKVCKVCGADFVPYRSYQKVCSGKCALELVREEKAKKVARERADRLKVRRQAVRPLSYFMRQAQQAFNAFIRYRDRDEPCISCGRYHNGQYHAGHFLTTAAHPELRFNEDNAHKQCQPCNTHLSGNLTRYRPALIAKIGQARFDALTGPHERRRWTREECIRIRDEYRMKLREMKKRDAA